MAQYFNKNLKYIRTLKGISQQELADKIGVDQTTIAKWENDKADPSLENVVKITEALDVFLPEFVGKNLQLDNIDILNIPSNIVKIPVLGKIPAGIPFEAIEDIIDYEEIPREWLKGGKEYFGLQIEGNSMEPEYKHHDILIVLKENDCESGQDAIIMVNGDDATFKRVIKQDNNIILKPLNNEYNPTVFTEYDIITKPVKIIGVVKEIRRKVN